MTMHATKILGRVAFEHHKVCTFIIATKRHIQGTMTPIRKLIYFLRSIGNWVHLGVKTEDVVQAFAYTMSGTYLPH